MSQMLNQLANYDSIYLIGGNTSFQHYGILENLMTTAGKMVLAKLNPLNRVRIFLNLLLITIAFTRAYVSF